MNYISTFEVATRYVLGFAFTPSRKGVILIKKRRPNWQAGKLNGPGGKIEAGETPEQAMIREFKEETGIDTELGQWSDFCAHVRPSGDERSYSLDLFSTVLTLQQYQQLDMPTDEEPCWRSVEGMNFTDEAYVDGTVMYIAMAMNHMGRPFHTVTLEIDEEPV
jgi:8-oxo-dGTP pyrophosphatase MutT (NUDIX family)